MLRKYFWTQYEMWNGYFNDPSVVKAVAAEAGVRSNGTGECENCQWYRINNLRMGLFSKSNKTKQNKPKQTKTERQRCPA